MGRIIPYILENKQCLKPPTSGMTYTCQFEEEKKSATPTSTLEQTVLIMADFIQAGIWGGCLWATTQGWRSLRAASGLRKDGFGFDYMAKLLPTHIMLSCSTAPFQGQSTNNNGTVSAICIHIKVLTNHVYPSGVF